VDETPISGTFVTKMTRNRFLLASKMARRTGWFLPTAEKISWAQSAGVDPKPKGGRATSLGLIGVGLSTLEACGLKTGWLVVRQSQEKTRGPETPTGAFWPFSPPPPDLPRPTGEASERHASMVEAVFPGQA